MAIENPVNLPPDIVSPPPEDVQSFIDRLVGPIYRFHLGRSENYLEAQNHTIRTLQQAARERSLHRPEMVQERTWVMGIARYQQAYGSHRNLVFLNGGTGIDELPGDQDTILLREEIAKLANSWKHMPTNEADALALHFLCGLSLSEVGTILGKGENEVHELVSQGVYFRNELFDLAGRIQPSGAFKLALVEEVLYGPENHPLPFWSWWRKTRSWVTAYRLRNYLAAGYKISQIGLLASALILGLYLTQRPSIAPHKTTPTPTLVALLKPTPPPQDFNLLMISDAMVPPASGTCQTWKTNLESLVSNPFTILTAQQFDDPTGTNRGISGTGCELQSTISGPGQDNATKTVRNISRFFANDGFSQVQDFDNLPEKQGSAFFTQACPGFGNIFQSADLYAFLSVSYCVDNPSQANGATLNQTAVKGYTLRLYLATSSVQAGLNAFFKLWAADNNQAVGFLAPDLSNHYRSVNALDQLVGITRLVTSSLKFDWQPIQNTGQDLKVAVNVESFGFGSQPEGIPFSFQLDLTQFNGVWDIESLGKTSSLSLAGG